MLRSFCLTFCCALLALLFGILLACWLAPHLLLPGETLFHLHVIPSLFNGGINDIPAYELILLAPWIALAGGLLAAMQFRLRILRQHKMHKIRLLSIENHKKNNVLFCSDRFAKRQP